LEASQVANGKIDRVRVILGTGGTIAGRASRAGDNVGYVAGQVGVSDLVGGIPALEGLALEVEQVAQVDSKDMDFAVWRALADRLAHHLTRDEVSGVVITHGTDTLEETAFFLQQVLKPAKPVVLACAMRPATALVPDGPQNLLDAVTVAGDRDAHGVMVVCAGQVHAAQHVAKVHSYRTDAFDSGDAGPIGCVEEGVLRLFHPWPAERSVSPYDTAGLARIRGVRALPRVVWLISHADADGTLVRGLLALGAQEPGRMPRGIVVAGTGNGTLHRSLMVALDEAQAAGVRVVRATRCARGRVICDGRGPFAEVTDLSPAKARLALALSLLGD
jgi:L-asparaginase